MKKITESFEALRKVLMGEDVDDMDDMGDKLVNKDKIELSPEEIHDKILDYFKENPSPEDDDIHDFAEELGLEPDEFEEHIYKILGELLAKKDEEPIEEPIEEPKEEPVEPMEEPKEEAIQEAVEITKEQEPEIYQLMADVISVGLAQVEKTLNQEFESTSEAEKFVQDMFRKFRTNARQYLMQSLRRFDRQGAQRISREFRRKIKI